jgi:cytochrome c oxidase accessory protein FixG
MNASYPTISLKPVESAAVPEQEERLYEVRKKIYPRAVHGWFAGWRVFFVLFTQVIFYGLPWLTWNNRQAVLFDLAARKFYIFGIVFWPQDFIYLTVLLISSALSLFLFTAAAGRLWCGYACPQTVYTEIFMWVEQKIEGHRAKRMKLDQAPWSARKLALKGAKHGVWAAIALWTGFTFVGYFTPIKTLAAEVASFSLGPWETFWLLFYGFATYGNAGWMREQVCKYMCPYARFQSVMFDRDTLTVTYDIKRGEPRGPRRPNIDYRAAGLGDCVNCGICVQVCPVGIDIRKGLQYECIGCAACIDGCNQVMDKMGYPLGLIRYSTENAVARGYTWKQMVRRIVRPRVFIYTAILGAIITAAAIALYTRVPLKVDVIRDRGSLAREVDDGRIENVYRLQIMNTAEVLRRYTISASGLPTLEVASEQMVEIGPASTKAVPVRLQLAPGQASRGSHRIDFHVRATDDERVAVTEKSSFLLR